MAGNTVEHAAATPTAKTGRWKTGVKTALTKVLPVALSLVVLVVVIAWMSGVFTEKITPETSYAPRRAAANQPTAAVDEIVKDYVEEAVGTLKAADRTQISSRLMARIQEVRVQGDSTVKKGDPVIILHEGELRARLNQANQQLLAAGKKLIQLEQDYKRIKSARMKDAATQSELDAAEANFEVAKANEKVARESILEAKEMLAYTKIVAPRSGRIVDRLAEPGDMAVPGQPLLTMYDPKTLRLEVPVMEQLALKLEVGGSIKVRIDALDREFEGTIAQRVPQAEAASRSFLVKVDLKNQQGLFEGMFGRLLIPAGRRRHLCLPTESIRTIGQLQFVDIVRKDGTLERRFIKTGRLGFPGHIEVLSGVEAGETVVLYEGKDSQGEQAP